MHGETIKIAYIYFEIFQSVVHLLKNKAVSPLSKKEISSLLFFIHKITKISDLKIPTYILHRTDQPRGLVVRVSDY